MSSLATTRGKIIRIGEIEHSPTGGAVFKGWGFDGEGRDVPAYVYDETSSMHDRLAGWAFDELHIVAHGFPCKTVDCPMNPSRSALNKRLDVPIREAWA